MAGYWSMSAATLGIVSLMWSTSKPAKTPSGPYWSTSILSSVSAISGMSPERTIVASLVLYSGLSETEGLILTLVPSVQALIQGVSEL